MGDRDRGDSSRVEDLFEWLPYVSLDGTAKFPFNLLLVLVWELLELFLGLLKLPSHPPRSLRRHAILILFTGACQGPASGIEFPEPVIVCPCFGFTGFG